MQMDQNRYYLQVLDEEFARRRAKDARYSLRSYADDLELNAGSLSSILTGKRMIPARKVMPIVRKLELTGDKQRQFLESLPKGAPSPKNSQQLDPERVRVLFEEWEYFVILALFRLEDFESSAAWIAERAGIPAERVEDCLDHLFTLGFVRENTEGVWERSHSVLHSTHDTPSSAIRASHKENLRIAAEKLDAIPLEERDYSFLTVALDEKHFSKLKRLVLKFRDEISELDETSPKKRLYRIAVQCFPLTKKNSKEPS